jgi:hypothetical protein
MMIQRPLIRIGLTIFLLIFASQGLIADYIHLTNTSGKSIEVEIFSIDEGKVKLQIRGDYKTYNYPLTQLDSASQTLVTELMNPKSIIAPNKPESKTITPEGPNRKYDIELITEYRNLHLKRRDQGSRHASVIFSFAHILDYTLAKAGSEDIISTEFLNWACKKQSIRNKDNTLFLTIGETIEKYGILIEKDYRYNSNKYSPNRKPKEDIIEIGKQNLEKLKTIEFEVKCIIQKSQPTGGPGLENKHIEQIIQLLENKTPVALNIGYTKSVSIFGYKGKGPKDKKGKFLIIDSRENNIKELSYQEVKTITTGVYYIKVKPHATINLISK